MKKLAMRFVCLMFLAAVLCFGQPSYHGGLVLTQGARVYAIFYGPNWPDTDKENVRRFFAGVGVSSYFGGMTSYYDAVGIHVAAASQLVGEFANPGTYGLSPASTSLPLIVQDAITEMAWPCDPGAVYAVVGSSGTTTPLGGGGWHFQFPCGPTGSTVQVAALHALVVSSLNVAILSHELVETISDPFGNAWYRNSDGQEISDMCGTYGSATVMGQSYYVANYYSLNGGCGGAGGSTPPPPPPPPPNANAPTLIILSPADGSAFPCGSVQFAAAAVDVEDGTISGKIIWRVGTKQVGTGGSLTVNFGCGGPNLGNKTVIASVSDSGGKSDTDSVNITIRKRN